VPLDLVEAGDVDALSDDLAALKARVRALSAVAEAVATGGGELRADARAALRLPVPAEQAEALIVEAWGCPVCGRVDAPQPCLGVCIREPVLMEDAAGYRALAEQVARARAADAELTTLVRLVAFVSPRAGQEQATWAALRARASAVRDRPPDDEHLA
jgi:hypothetical protein